MNIGIWVVGTSNQLILRGSHTETNFKKNKVVTGQTLCSPLLTYFNIGLSQANFVQKCCFFNIRTSN